MSCRLEVGIQCECHLLLGLSHARHGILCHPLLKEVRLALQGNPLHPRKWVRRSPDLRIAQRQHQTICHELDVITHAGTAHADQSTGQCLRDELLLNTHSLPHDLDGLRLRQLMLTLGVQQTRKVGMETLVTANKLVGRGQPRHEPPLLQPEDRAECPAEEHTLHDGEGQQPRGEIGLVAVDPLARPRRFLLDTGHVLDGLKHLQLLRTILYVSIDEQRVGLGVDRLHEELGRVEELRLRQLDLIHEALGQILHHDSIGSGKEAEDSLDEMLLLWLEGDPVGHVLRQIDLLGLPEDGHVILVLFPDRGVLYGKDDVAVGISNQERLLGIALLALRYSYVMKLCRVNRISCSIIRLRVGHQILDPAIFSHRYSHPGWPGPGQLLTRLFPSLY